MSHRPRKMVSMPAIERLSAALAEAPYIRHLSWDVFYTAVEDEDHDVYMIQRVDSPEIEDTADGIGFELQARHCRWGFMESDLEAELLVCFLALDGDEEALEALREIGCDEEDLAPILAWFRRFDRSRVTQ